MNTKNLLKFRYIACAISVSIGIAIASGCGSTGIVQDVDSRKAQCVPTREMLPSYGSVKMNSKIIYLINHIQRNVSVKDIDEILNSHFNVVESRCDGHGNSFILYKFEDNEEYRLKSSFSITDEGGDLYPVIDFHIQSNGGDCAFRASQLYNELSNGLWKSLDYYVDDFTNGIKGEKDGFSIRAWAPGGYGMNNKLNDRDKDVLMSKYKSSDSCIEHIKLIYMHS